MIHSINKRPRSLFELLSSVFIRSAAYGTRASTLVRVREDGSRSIHERRFGPHGEPLGETRLELR